MLRPLFYLSTLMALTGAAGANICTVTGPTAIDFQGQYHPVKDRCAYTMLSDSSMGFEVLATFRERRRRDVSFLDSVTLKLQDPVVEFHLEQGGRVRMNDSELSFNSSVREFEGVWLSKDKTGIKAHFTISNHTMNVFFDSSTAQIHTEAPVWSSIGGLCVNSSSHSTQRLSDYSSSSCQTQYNDGNDTSINCTVITDHCNILKEAPFSPCNNDIDPTPYINACSDTLCKYPSVDGLRCQFLWAYARACSLNSSASLGDWWSHAKCSSPEAFCQDKTCSYHEFCGERLGGETGCLCRAAYAYDYKQSDTLGDPPVCKQNSASLTLVGCLLEERGIDYSVLHLNNRSCRGEMDEETHMVTFSFDSSNTCGMETTANGSKIIYKNAIKYQNSSDVITRQDQVYIEFSCQHTQPEAKIVVFKIKDSSVVVTVKSGDMNYTVTMKAFTDASRTQALDSMTDVALNQKIWVELTTTGLDESNIAVVTDSCWATSQESPSSKPRYDLIKDGCANSDDQTVQMEGNGIGTSNHFSFNMFQFTGSKSEVYLHCKLQLCVKEGNNCIPNCAGGSKRRRRSVKPRYSSGLPAFINLAWI